MISRAFEDFPIGTRLLSGAIEVTEESIIEFSKQFDPQPFHLDPATAKRTLFGGLAASGWHTAAISMRLFIQTMNVPGGIIGLGVEELHWPNAVRPGDWLRLDIEITDARLSKSRPGFGIIRIHNVTRNQRDEVVQSFKAGALLPTR
jgi:acyl dehydratase